MKKVFLLLLVFLSAFALTSCDNEDSDRIKVAVSIVPQEAFVDAVGGDLVEVVSVIPVGYSPANYEPSAKEIVDINQSEIYFTIGVPAESGNIFPELNDLYMVHLEEEVAKVYPDRYFDYEHTHDEEESEEATEEEHEDDDHSEFSRDPHIWLSIKRVKVMVEVIRDELIKLDPDHETIYRENAESYLTQLDQLDEQIEALFEEKTMRTFIVYHPSFGYFADDYDLEMLALEEDGKEPSITHLKELIDFARDNNITRIYHQAEIDSERVETFKKDINGISVEVYPLKYEYIDAMLDIAEKIAEGLS